MSTNRAPEKKQTTGNVRDFSAGSVMFSNDVEEKRKYLLDIAKWIIEWCVVAVTLGKTFSHSYIRINSLNK